VPENYSSKQLHVNNCIDDFTHACENKSNEKPSKSWKIKDHHVDGHLTLFFAKKDNLVTIPHSVWHFHTTLIGHCHTTLFGISIPR